MYSRYVLDGITELARKNRLILLADEIYDKILYDDASTSPSRRSPRPALLSSTALSKAYRVAGFRSGWMLVSGPRQHAAITSRGWTSSPTCGCAPTSGSARHPGSPRWPTRRHDLVLPGGRLHTSANEPVSLLSDCLVSAAVKPKGALYVFPRLDRRFTPSRRREVLLDLLLQEHLLVVQGTGSTASAGSRRIVTLPHVDDLEAAIGRSPVSGRMPQ